MLKTTFICLFLSYCMLNFSFAHQVRLQRSFEDNQNVSDGATTEENHPGGDVTEANHAGGDVTEANHAGVNVTEENHAGGDVTEANHAGGDVTETNHAGGDVTEANHAGGDVTETNHAGGDVTEENHAGDVTAEQKPTEEPVESTTVNGDKEASNGNSYDGGDWFMLDPFEEYLDDDNRTVIDDEDSPITIVGEPDDIKVDEAEDVVDEDEFIEKRSISRKRRRTTRLISVKEIPGTELFTGTFYKLGMKTFPAGFVTPSIYRNNDDYIKVEINLDPNDLLDNFKNNGSKQFQNEWMFAPSEVDGWYTFIPRANPKGFTTYTYKDSETSGFHVAVAELNSQVFYLLPGGKYRDDALWRPVDSGEEGFYKLELKSKPNYYATYAEHYHLTYNHYIQLVEKDFGDESKFKFSQGGITANAKILSMEWETTPQDVFKANSKKDKVDLHTIDVDNSKTKASMEYLISKSETKSSTWTFTFREHLEWLNSLSVEGNVGIPLLASGKVTGTISFRVGAEAEQQHETKTDQTFSINIKLIVPAETSITGKVYYEWVDNMELPFKATMAVQGTAARLANDQSGKIVQGPADPKLVEAYLKSEDEDSEFIGAVDRNKKVFKTQISGVLRGSMGTKTIVAIDGPEPDGLKIEGKHNKENKPKTTPKPAIKPPSKPAKKPNSSANNSSKGPNNKNRKQ